MCYFFSFREDYDERDHLGVEEDADCSGVVTIIQADASTNDLYLFDTRIMNEIIF